MFSMAQAGVLGGHGVVLPVGHQHQGGGPIAEVPPGKVFQLAADQFAQLLQQRLVGDDIEVVLLHVHGAGGIAARLYNGGQSGAVQGVRPKGPAAAPVQQQVQKFFVVFHHSHLQIRGIVPCRINACALL